MRKQLLILAAACILALSASAARAQMIAFVFNDETLMLPMPDGFRVGSSGPNTIHFIPQGEKIQNWTIIFSLMYMRHVDVPLYLIRTYNQEGFLKTCIPEHQPPENKPDRVENGYNVAEWTQACPLTISGPSKGHPEIDMFKVIQGKSVDVFAMAGFRFAPSPELVKEWSATLDQVRLRAK